MTWIRLAQAEDLPQLLQLYTLLGDNPLPSKENFPESLWTEMLQDPMVRVIVAETEGKIVSSCTLTLIRNLTHGQRPYGFIENVVTDPEYRKQGLASRCLEEAVCQATAMKAYKVMLMTGSKRESTLRFYRHAGFNDRDKTAFVRWLPVDCSIY